MDQDLFIQRLGFFPPVTFVMFASGEHERGRAKISQEVFYPAEVEPLKAANPRMFQQT